MANRKLSASTALTGASTASGDLFMIVDVSDTTDGAGGTNKKITQAEMKNVFQPLDADLTALAGLTSAADKVPYFTGSGTAAVADFTAAGRALVDDASASAQRTTLGLAIGTDVQAYDAQLASLAALAYAGNALKVVRVNAGATDFELAAGGSGDLLAANNLSDVASAATSRTNLGVGTGDSPQFTAVNVGHASDTTLARVSAGVASIEGVTIDTISAANTLTNKTLTSPIINSATGIGQIVVKYKAADETVNNSATLQDDDDLVLAVNSGEVWSIRYVLAINSPSTTSDFKFALTYPAVNAAYYGLSAAFNTALNSFAAQNAGNSPPALITASGTAISIGSINGTYGIVIVALIAPSASGNITLQWAQNTATVENTTVKKYSTAECLRIA